PNTRLAPLRLVSTRSPPACSAAATMPVVVVLPLVPVISTVPPGRLGAILRSTPRSTARATSPGTVVPPPRRRRRLVAAAALPEATAALRRRSAVILGSALLRRALPGVAGARAGWRPCGRRVRGTRRSVR